MQFKNDVIWVSDYSDQAIHIKIGEEYRDKGWDIYFGNIQETLKKSNSSNLHLWMDKCKWADPFPLLSLAIAVAEWRSKGKHLTLRLPDSDSLCHEQKGFLAFIAKERFLDTIVRYPANNSHGTIEIFDGDHEITDNIIDYTERAISMSSHMAYQNPGCVAAKIMDMAVCDDIGGEVDALIEQAKMKGLKHYGEPGRSMHEMSYDMNAIHIAQELRQILIELLRNVEEHAYDDEEFSNIQTRFAAVYARIRFGLSDEGRHGNKKKLADCYKQEDDFCPRLKYSGQLQQIGFIEIFVSDSGIGVARHFELKKKPTHPLNVFFNRMTTKKAFSRYSAGQREKQFRSPMPGLKYISDMLSQRNGFMRILYKKEWCGTSFPLESEERLSDSVGYYDHEKDKEFDYPEIHGAHINARISTGSLKKLPEKWNFAMLHDFSSFHKSNVIQAWQCRDESPQSWKKARFVVYDDHAVGLKKGGKSEYAKPDFLTVGGKGIETSYILWRPPKSIFRDKIIQRLKEIVSENHSHDHVIIADQDLAAALMTKWALNRITRDIFPGIVRITIITDTLCYSDLRLSDSLHEKMNCRFKSADRNFFSYDGEKTPIHLGHIVYALREMDSRLYWENIQTADKAKNFFIRGQIAWQNEIGSNEDKQIDSFINFLHTINEKTFRWIYRRTLARFLAYVSPEEDIHPIDHVVEAIKNSFYFHRNYNYDSGAGTVPSISGKRPFVLMGSVLVSGETASSIQEEWESVHENENGIIAHFFPHGNLDASAPIPDNFVWLLRWLLPEEESGADHTDGISRMERIVDSPLIGPGGNRHWRMTREFSMSGGKRRHIYGCSPDRPEGISPSEAYQFWQSRGLIRFGHWVDGSHHDCIGLNILHSLRMDYSTTDSIVWNFLLSHFKRLEPEYEENNGFPACDLLACVVNEGTMLVLKKCVELFGDWFNEKTVLLPLVQRRRKAMRLRISSLDIMRLKEKVDEIKKRKKESGKKEDVNVLLFDLTISSVRTFLELKNLVSAQGAKDVYSIALLDRSRLPNHENVFLQRERWKRDARLWRFDLDYLSPSDGPNYSAGCFLCESVEKIDRMLSRELTENVSSRLTEWKELGRPRSLAGAPSFWGLPGSRIFKSKQIKFGLKPGDSDAWYDKVEIEQSTALCAVLMEIMTITGRHDLVLRYVTKIDEEKKKTEKNNHIEQLCREKIEILIAQFLYMRSDLEYRRRLSICRELLTALFESPDENKSTAFAGLIFFSIETSLVKALLPKIAELMELNSPGTNFDFHLVASHLISRAGQRALSKIQKKNARDLLISLSTLSEPISRSSADRFMDIFLLMGTNAVDTSGAILFKLLQGKADRRKNIPTVYSLIERLSDIFKEISKNSYLIPSEVEHETIRSYSHKLADIKNRIYKRIGSDAADISEDTLAIIFSFLFDFFYGEDGFCDKIHEWFTKGFNELNGFFENILDKTRQDDIDPMKISISVFCKVSHSEKKSIRALVTRQVEDCVFESICHAYKNSTRAFESGHHLACEFGINRNCEINLKIRYNFDNAADIKSRSSININHLESLGGKIEETVENNEGAIIICLPLSSRLAPRLSPRNEMKNDFNVSGLRNPYTYGAPVTGDDFYGRRDEIESIINDISD